MADVENVAEAIWRAAVDKRDKEIRTWPDVINKTHYRALALAAIDALGLTEEQRTNAMSSAGMTTDTKTGVTTVHSDIRYDRRLVGPWQ
jgi:hypothetical protein